MKMLSQEQRLEEIKEMLAKKHKLTTHELADHFGIAFDTARRDVLRLTSTGQAARIHGGLMEIKFNNVPGFVTRSHIQSPIKAKIARLAREEFNPSGLYFVGASTTLMQMCEQLGQINTTIMTNSIDNAVRLMLNKLPEVELLGGKIDKGNRYTYSMETLSQLDNITFDAAFIGTSKIQSDGVMVVDSYDAAIAKKVVERSRKVILVAQKYKFVTNNSSPYKSANLKDIDVLITDVPLEEKYRKYFKPDIKIKYVKEDEIK